MSDTLLIRLAGPMQAWGTQSQYSDRDSGREPSKSGVVGLLCAAMGRDRALPLDDLAALRMGVRVDREGGLLVDYHTSQNAGRASLSNRVYLTDAVFLVGFEGDAALLQSLQAALRNPHWMLWLGRKACPPAQPVWLADGLRLGEALQAALTVYPSLTPQLGKRNAARLRLVIEDSTGERAVHDQPLSFATRSFAMRRVHTRFCDNLIPESGSQEAA